MVTSGTISMLADTGEYYEFHVSNIPMNNDYEDRLKAENGLDALVFSISGTAISSHFSNVNVNEPSLGTFSRYFAADDSEILIILVAATDSQLTELLGDY